MSGMVNRFFQGSRVVYRHLQTGDMLLLNRQPNPHKPGVRAHKARIF